MNNNYLEVNKNSWNKRTEVHFDSSFYDNESFIKGRSSLNSIELALFGDLKGKTVLHLQCHFGQDTLSLERLGAKVTGVDLSDVAIEKANVLANKLNSSARFICSDVYGLSEVLDEEFDYVFTSYGTIGWLPDIDKWAGIVSKYLKPGGQFVFAEFHPVVWMFDDDFKSVKYRYFNDEPIIDEEGTYTDGEEITTKNISWNHGLSEVITALIKSGLSIKQFNEFDYSPYNCFQNMEELPSGGFYIKHIGQKIPMVYSLLAEK
ncbi:MAG: class I SAM-dependent methyltransferase [Salibacteraceae bacterium]